MIDDRVSVIGDVVSLPSEIPIAPKTVRSQPKIRPKREKPNATYDKTLFALVAPKDA